MSVFNLYSNMFKKEVEIKHLPIREKLEKIEKGEAHWFFPHHVFEQVIIILLIMGVMISLVTLFPPHLGEKADPFVTPEHIKPEWYFLAGYQFLKIAEIFEFFGRGAPKIIGVAGQGIVIFFLFISSTYIKFFTTAFVSKIAIPYINSDYFSKFSISYVFPLFYS